jgi:hypothetical protein
VVNVYRASLPCPSDISHLSHRVRQRTADCGIATTADGGTMTVALSRRLDAATRAALRYAEPLARLKIVSGRDPKTVEVWF